MEHDPVHLLMKKLKILYNISMTNSDEIFGKEIELLKKQINQLHQHENETANESTKKTIFGVDKDDLDNYDTDFTDLRKAKVE
ncbi:merozoite surface protein 7 [Plasmodium cynomolgi strain B]|uniref:Merozoite surface protein 7 n=1 Tax=Plasmodium cynomolgi (strain B) TaxID=1120755 RepID=K6UVV3_PLACD|nr:merozoite surface protein 7 [Plasmodium cynomolgi strain B]GAB67709.1 merozoite surface protein 7 [Plasmodium cynomolgi strain B]